VEHVPFTELVNKEAMNRRTTSTKENIPCVGREVIPLLLAHEVPRLVSHSNIVDRSVGGGSPPVDMALCGDPHPIITCCRFSHVACTRVCS
jgi:hypothetical protein